jgi:SNF2 family DNA or RNA helicase
MGLGKTLQVTALLTGLMKAKAISRALIVCPVSVMQNWRRELSENLQAYLRHSTVDMISSELSINRRKTVLR